MIQKPLSANQAAALAAQLAAISARLDSLVALKEDIAAIKAAWMDNTEPQDEPKDPPTDLVKEEVSSDSSSDVDEVSVQNVSVDNLDFVMESVAVPGVYWVKAYPDVVGEKLKSDEKKFVLTESPESPDGILSKKETSVDNFASGNMTSFSGGFRYGSAFSGQAYGGDLNRRYNSINSFLWYYSSFSPGTLIITILVSCGTIVPPDLLLISVQHLPMEEAYRKITIYHSPNFPLLRLEGKSFLGREVLIHSC